MYGTNLGSCFRRSTEGERLDAVVVRILAPGTNLMGRDGWVAQSFAAIPFASNDATASATASGAASPSQTL